MIRLRAYKQTEQRKPILMNRLPLLDSPSPVLLSKLFPILVHTTKANAAGNCTEIWQEKYALTHQIMLGYYP